MTEYRPWPRDTRYLVGDDGTIIGLRGRPLKGVVRDGRPGTTVTLEGREQRILIAVIVCETFHGPRPEGRQVAHEDGDPLNSRASNLAWKTAQENAADRDRHGRTARGEKNGWARLTEDDVLDIRARRASGETLDSIAYSHGVSLQHVWRICRREVWAHVA